MHVRRLSYFGFAFVFFAVSSAAFAQVPKATVLAVPPSATALLDSPIPQGMGRLVFSRSNTPTGSAITMDVWVDRHFVAKLGNGQFASLLAEPGEHLVELWFSVGSGISPNASLWEKAWSDIGVAYAAFCPKPTVFSPTVLRVPLISGGISYIELVPSLKKDKGMVKSTSGKASLDNSVTFGTLPNIDLKKLKQANATLAAIYSNGSMAVAGASVASSAARADILEKRDASGYNPEGYDREGYDLYGWTNPLQIVALVTEVIPGSPAAVAGLVPGAIIRGIDGGRFSKIRDFSFQLSSKKPGDTIILSVSTASSRFRDLSLRLEGSSTEPGWAGIGYNNKIQAYPSENRAGESWNGRIANGRQGKGLLFKTDGSIYIGSFIDDKADGRGALVSTAGAADIQDWSKGALIASRRPAGSILSSIYRWIYLGDGAAGGLAQGRGDAVTTDGRYRIEGGLFEKGRLVEGSIVFPGGTRHSGNFTDDRLVKGVIYGSDGSRFDGQLANGVPEGKGTVITADSTTYTGTFAAGLYEGQGTIARPSGEKYEGNFKAGKPHGSGIYFNGSSIERCEYYEGQRIDQVYLMRIENEKMLEAQRRERERIAKERADQAEQARLAAERASAQQNAQSEKSSNNLIAGIFGVGAALAGGKIGMNAEEAAQFGFSTFQDVKKGDASMSGMKKTTGQGIVDARSASTSTGSTAGSTAGSGAPASRLTKPKPHTISYGGKPNTEVTADVDSKYFTTYDYPDGSWFKLDRSGTGQIHYALDSRGQRNSGPPLPITWGIQLDKDGYILDRSGYWILYVILKVSGEEDKAELLELGGGQASGWKMR